MKYQIRYDHTAWDGADNIWQAKERVRNEGRVNRLYSVRCQDGIYCYLSIRDMRSDRTGAAAFAVICREEER